MYLVRRIQNHIILTEYSHMLMKPCFIIINKRLDKSLFASKSEVNAVKHVIILEDFPHVSFIRVFLKIYGRQV